jgi:uncharacterized protein DUF4338
MSIANLRKYNFCGHLVSPEELELVKSVISDCSGISRTELANTLCEILDWRRPNGKLKTVECRAFLEELDSKAIIKLPVGRSGRPRCSRTSIAANYEPEITLNGKKNEFEPIEIIPVLGKEENAQWRAMVDRYHYLGHCVPFGAHLRYFIRVHNPDPVIVGCLQFSSPAWRMEARDSYLGWDDTARRANLQKIVSNSRFLILPSVRIKNLASNVLSVAKTRIASDWESRYCVRVLLLETLVDTARYSGTCYRAANWIEVGRTTGRGRDDSMHLRHGKNPKTVFLSLLTKNAVRQLREV